MDNHIDISRKLLKVFGFAQIRDNCQFINLPVPGIWPDIRSGN
jgi:hypothetical protein